MKWEKEMDLALRAAKAAGSRLREIATGHKKILSAEGRDIKLQADQDAEKVIIDMIAAESDYPILAEESGEHGQVGSGPCWVIDPLDGTFNFSRGVPLCSISIALVEGTEPILGTVYDFNRDELFYGIVGEGAWRNAGEPIHVSNVTQASKGILITGFPIRMDLSIEALQPFMKKILRFKKIRMIGTAALSLAYVACGIMDAYSEDAIMLWDIAAGLALVKAAGGDLIIEPSDKSKWARNVRVAASRSIWEQD